MCRHTRFHVASLAAGALCLLGSASASAYDHVDAAFEFVTSSPSNDWGSPCSIDWSTYVGVTKASCFFTLSFAHANGYSGVDIRNLWGSTSPTAAQYFALVDASPAVGAPDPAQETYFRRVTTASQIQRGDILVINATSTYSGHLAMITGPATEITPQVLPTLSGTKQWAVPIIDSTTTSHGCSLVYPDSRWHGPCPGAPISNFVPGAGTATMRVYTDALTGVLLGYTWSVSSSMTTYYAPDQRPYRIGRLVNLPEPAQPPSDPPPPP